MKIVARQGSQVLELLSNGAQQLLEVVGATLGPGARTGVVLQEDFRRSRGWSDTGTIFSRDGEELAGSFFLPDPFEQVAIKLIREAASQMSAQVGDGTSVTVILACKIFIEAAKFVAAGCSPHVLANEICQVAASVGNYMAKSASPLDSYEQLIGIARTSSQGNFLEAEAIAEAVRAVGFDGYVGITSTQANVPRVIITDGLTLRGSILRFWIPNGDQSRSEVIFNPSIIIIDDELDVQSDIDPLSEFIRNSKNPVVICAKGFGKLTAEERTIKKTANLLIQVAKEVNIQLLLFRVSFSEAVLADVAAYCGCSVLQGVPTSLGKEAVGTAESLTIGNGELRFRGANTGSLLYMRTIDSLEQVCESADSGRQDEEADSGLLGMNLNRIYSLAEYDDGRRKRIALLRGAHCSVAIPARSPVQKAQVTKSMANVVRSIQVAKISGFLPGGGEVYLRAAQELGRLESSGEAKGLGAFAVAAVRRALDQPASWIAANAGREPTSVLEKIAALPSGTGFDAYSDRFVDLKMANILDACGVAILAVRTAASTAAYMLRIGTIVGAVTGESDLSEHDLAHLIRR